MKLEDKICARYAELLTGMFLHIGERGEVLFPGEKNEHVEVEDRKLYLPLAINLDDRNLRDAAFFHPICEDALLGQSKMIHFLTRRVQAAISFRLDAIVECMFSLATDSKAQKKIKNSEAIRYLAAMKDVKPLTVAKWGKFVQHMSDNGGLFSIYLNRNKEIDGVHYARVCVLDSPIMRDELKGATLCGYNVHSGANKTLFRTIVTELIGKIDMEFGSNHSVPYFDSLMQAYIEVTKRLNYIIGLFGGSIDQPVVNVDWYQDLMVDNFDSYHRIIPVLEFNGGQDVKSVAGEEVKLAGERVDNLPNQARSSRGLNLKDFDNTNRRRDDRDRRRDDDRSRGDDRDYRDFVRETTGRYPDDDRDDRRDGRRDRRRDYDDRDRWSDERYDRERRNRLRDGFGRDDRRDDRRRDDRDDRRDDRRDSRRGLNLADYD